VEHAEHGRRRGSWIKIFLAEGSPSGLKTVERSNWTGLGVVCPRPRFADVRDRDEFKRAGVYVLVGPSESPDVPIVYIGEADPLRARLDQQHAQRDFWTIAYFFTSKDENLNKAHIEYLEYRLVTLAKEVKRSRLENSNVPGKPSLSPSDQAEMDTFLDEMLLCFPTLGVFVFEKPEEKPATKTLLSFTRRGLTATGYESDNGFVVVKGSQASLLVVKSMQPFAQSLRSELLTSGVLVEAPPNLVFAEDYEFSSPSTAAYVVAGASVNGRDVWKTEDDRSLKELQEAESEE
jgi:hypothetical protein